MDATHFDQRITKRQAEEILQKGLDVRYGFTVMCKEYGYDNRECSCEYEDTCTKNNKDSCYHPECHESECEVFNWVGLMHDDLDGNGKLIDDYQTFEI